MNKLLNEKYLDRDNCNMVRGIVALVIILHHTAYYTNYPSIVAFLLKNIGASMATVFFFYSGYGLMISYKNKADYLNGFFRKRVLSILIPYLIANVLYSIYYLAVGDKEALIHNLTTFYQGNTVVLHTWYVVVILALYCLFFIAFYMTKCDKGMIVCIIFNVLLIVFLASIGFGEWWYNTCAAFSFGLVFAKYKKEFDLFLTKNYLLKMIVFAACFMALLLVGKKIHITFLLVVIKSVRAMVFSVLALMLSMLLRGKVKVIDFLGSISFEMYMYQAMFMLACSKFGLGKMPVVFAIAVVVLTIVAGFIMNQVDRKVNAVLK